MNIDQVRPILKDEKIFTNAFEHASIGMALVSPAGYWLMVNQALCTLFGYTENELLSLKFQQITHPQDLESDLQYLEKLFQGKMASYQKEKRYYHKNGSIIHALLNVSLVRDEQELPHFLISQVQDITEKKQLEKQLLKQAKQDELTTLCNRRCFLESTAKELTRSARYSEATTLLMLDIDHFKTINDTYGHGIGDEALREMALVCKNTLRPFDIIGRIGGEEFAALLIKADITIGEKVAERLRKAIAKIALPTPQGPLSFTVSIGGFTCKGANLALKQLMEYADQALYTAKRDGRNNVKIAIDRLYDADDTSGFIRLQWQEAYESGNKRIDSQHKELFLAANKLLALLANQYDLTTLLSLYDDLLQAIGKHFGDEEQIMRNYHYRELTQHTQIHHSLLEKATQVSQELKKGQVELIDMLQLFVVDIVHKHLLVEDRKFFPVVAG